MRLDTLVGFLDEYLGIAEEVADAPAALNGLQVSKSGDVSRLAAAVDLCEATVRQAVEQHADCLLVHHGMFWGGLRPLVGPAYRRVAGLIKGNIALYAAHLPLDRHPEVGNNRVLARMLDIKVSGDFGSYHGAPAGVWGTYSGKRDELSWALTKALGTAPRLFPFGPERVQRVGIVTGAGGSLIPQAALAGLDTFVAGALVSAIFTLADRLSARRLVAGAAALAAAATLGVAASTGIGAGIVCRLLTGAALAGVYPPGMKIAAGWFKEGRGLAIGILVGALTRLCKSASRAVGGFANGLAHSARDCCRQRAGGRTVGPPRAKRWTVRRPFAAVFSLRRSTDPQRPRRRARQPRIPWPHVGAVRDVDMDRGVRRGERTRAPGRAGRCHRARRPGHIRRRGQRSDRMLARRKVRRPLRPHVGDQRGDGGVGQLCSRCRIAVRRSAGGATPIAPALGDHRRGRLSAVFRGGERAGSARLRRDRVDAANQLGIPPHLRDDLLAPERRGRHRLALEHECPGDRAGDRRLGNAGAARASRGPPVGRWGALRDDEDPDFPVVVVGAPSRTSVHQPGSSVTQDVDAVNATRDPERSGPGFIICGIPAQRDGLPIGEVATDLDCGRPGGVHREQHVIPADLNRQASLRSDGR